MSNVRPGDRAIVIKARHPQNIGKICVVIEPAKEGELRDGYWTTFNGWYVESLSGPFAIGNHGEHSHMVASVKDEWLRKLPDPDEVREHDAALVGLKDRQPAAEKA